MKSVDDVVAELRIKIAKNLARDVGIVSIDCDDALALSQMAADFAVMLAEGKRAIAPLQREADGMREALEARERDLSLVLASLRNLEAATDEYVAEEEGVMIGEIEELKTKSLEGALDRNVQASPVAVRVDPVQVIHGDSREALKLMADASVDSVVCDPPYALVSIAKRFGSATAAPVRVGDESESNNLKAAYARQARGFMGKTWDTGETAFDPAFWVEVLRVLKPGGHLIAFGGTRTYHRLVCAIEDAGFEIRDQLAWLFGSGFPKSHNLPGGWGTALKPAHEPICLARKPLIGTVAINMAAHGTGALNIDASRIEHSEECRMMNASQANIISPSDKHRQAGRRAPVLELKPAGRWPANVIHDGSEEVLRHFPETQSGELLPHHRKSGNGLAGSGTFAIRDRTGEAASVFGDAGSAARFFYTAKADADDRLGSKHPTVKPVDLMAYLVRLVTPPGGLVLDPFAGSGTTGMACMREGFRAILIEREAEYVADIKRRIAHVRGDDAPLFAEAAP